MVLLSSFEAEEGEMRERDISASVRCGSCLDEDGMEEVRGILLLYRASQLALTSSKDP